MIWGLTGFKISGGQIDPPPMKRKDFLHVMNDRVKETLKTLAEITCGTHFPEV